MLQIYFRDLIDETQKKVLAFYNIHTPEEENFDVFPLFCLEGQDPDHEA